MPELESTWAPRDLPILSVALRRLDAGAGLVDFADIAQETGLSRDQLWAGVRALETAQRPYIETRRGTRPSVPAFGLLTRIAARNIES